GLVNASVQLNSSLRALHTARVAVRLFAALAELLRDRPYLSEESPVAEAYEDRLKSGADCLQRDLDGMPMALKSGFVDRPVPWQLFGQTLALALAHSGLEEALDTRRIWGLDFRLRGLEQLSSDQLFFVYYALDNCQRADGQALRRLSSPLPGQERVNVPLRNWPPFGRHWGCQPGQAMVAPRACALLRPA
ncbi:unnamed protein product, partial [Ixodes hexagonus]